MAGVLEQKRDTHRETEREPARLDIIFTTSLTQVKQNMKAPLSASNHTVENFKYLVELKVEGRKQCEECK